MKALLATLGILLGVLLCVAGVVVALVTGFEPLYLGLGLGAVALGALLSWACWRAQGGQRAVAGDGGRERSRPPEAPAAPPKSPRNRPLRRDL